MGLSRQHVRANAAASSLVEKYSDRITGVTSCYDRMLFKGYLPIGWSDVMEGLLSRQGLLIKDFGKFVLQQFDRLQWGRRLSATETSSLVAVVAEAANASMGPSPFSDGNVCLRMTPDVIEF